MSIRKINPAEKLVVFAPQIEIWSGTVKVVRDKDYKDYGSMAGNIPPKQLISDGRKRLVGTEPLRALQNVRKRLERELAEKGVRFTGIGYGVPEAEAEEVIASLAGHEADFNGGVTNLVNTLDLHYAAQEGLYPEWSAMLHEARLSPQQVEDRCAFGVAVFRMTPPPGDEGSTGTRMFEQMGKEILPKLLRDIKKGAVEATSRLQGRGAATRRQVDPVYRMVAKLKSFIPIEGRVGPAVAFLERELQDLPIAGPVDAFGVNKALATLRLLADPNAILAHGQGIRDGVEPESDDTPEPLDLNLESSEETADQKPGGITPPATQPTGTTRRPVFNISM